jgi:hypothetical protein
VDADERSQIRLILEHISSQVCKQSIEHHEAMHADRAAAKILGSGDTVRKALDIVEADAREFITKAIDQSAAVAQDMDAFALIRSSFEAIMRHFEGQIAIAVKLAARSEDSPHYASTKREADRLFSELKSHMKRELEIHSFTFTKPSKSRVKEIGELFRTTNHLPTIGKPSNTGGKPLAKHWDAMWADIAVKLWQGDLNPKSQADVKAAMFGWFNAQGIDVGETAVRDRARQLWLSIQASG